ncbi:FYVE zinc finger-domain-containing protein [Zopfochytrium polystomum]|nr:FYVE zinc finger-domain-containing protein [Zopfochytrium polystomum]
MQTTTLASSSSSSAPSAVQEPEPDPPPQLPPAASSASSSSSSSGNYNSSSTSNGGAPGPSSSSIVGPGSAAPLRHRTSVSRDLNRRSSTSASLTAPVDPSPSSSAPSTSSFSASSLAAIPARVPSPLPPDPPPRVPTPNGTAPTGAAASSLKSSSLPRRPSLTSFGNAPLASSSTSLVSSTSSLAAGTATNGTASSTKPKGEIFECPICAEKCVSLFQLNQHLDDEHTEIEDAGTMIMQWFRKTHRTAAKAMQSTTQKAAQSFDKLDKMVTGAVGGFELNPGSGGANGSGDVARGGDGSNGSSSSNGGGGGSGGSTSALDGFLNDNSGDGGGGGSGEPVAVTRKHWKRGTGSDVCGARGCGRALSGPALRVAGLVVAGAGKRNCEKCGELFCDAHTAFQMKLAPKDARHDPVNGVWCRVCEGCYTGREGYLDTMGVSRKRTVAFLKVRKAKIDLTDLEANKLEKRLDKLYKLYAEEVPLRAKRSSISSITGLGSGTKDLDKQVVSWENDALVSKCRFCDQPFSTLLKRRHHCRLCGRVVCGSESCSANIPLQPPGAVSKGFGPFPIPSQSSTTTFLSFLVLCLKLFSIGVLLIKKHHTFCDSLRSPRQDGDEKVLDEVRVCKECKVLVLRRRNASADLLPKPDVVKLYENIQKLQAQANDALPKFNNLIMSLANAKEVRAEDRDYVMATRLRKTLLDKFAEIDQLGKRIRSLPASTKSSAILHENIYQAALQYLQNNMFTLQFLPKTTAAATAAAAAAAAADSATSPSSGGGSGTAAARLTRDERARLDAAAAALEALEAQEDQLRAFIEDATRRRRLEDAAALREALAEIVGEVDRVKREIGALAGSKSGAGGSGLGRSK